MRQCAGVCGPCQRRNAGGVDGWQPVSACGLPELTPPASNYAASSTARPEKVSNAAAEGRELPTVAHSGAPIANWCPMAGSGSAQMRLEPDGSSGLRDGIDGRGPRRLGARSQVLPNVGQHLQSRPPMPVRGGAGDCATATHSSGLRRGGSAGRAGAVLCGLDAGVSMLRSRRCPVSTLPGLDAARPRRCPASILRSRCCGLDAAVSIARARTARR
jgi:hypothetical protein